MSAAAVACGGGGGGDSSSESMVCRRAVSDSGSGTDAGGLAAVRAALPQVAEDGASAAETGTVAAHYVSSSHSSSAAEPKSASGAADSGLDRGASEEAGGTGVAGRDGAGAPGLVPRPVARYSKALLKVVLQAMGCKARHAHKVGLPPPTHPKCLTGCAASPFQVRMRA